MPAVKKGGFNAPAMVTAPKVSPATSPTSKGVLSSAFKPTKAARKPTASKAAGSTTGGGAGDGKKEKKEKKPKDPNAPKKPSSAYILYSLAQSSVLKAADPTIKQSEVMKRVGALWSAASAEVKQPYEAQAAEQKSAYTEAVGQYRVTNPDSVLFAPAPTKAAKSSSSGNKEEKEVKKDKKEKKEKKEKEKRKKSKEEEDDDAMLEQEDEAADAALFPELANDAASASPASASASASAAPPAAVAPPMANARGGSKRKAGAQAEASMKHLHRLETSKVIVATHGDSEEDAANGAASDESDGPVRKYSKSKPIKPASSTAGGDNVTSVAQRKQRNMARSSDAATSIPNLRGIKQEHLPKSEDLLHSKVKLHSMGAFPADFEPTDGEMVSLVLAPYRAYLQTLSRPGPPPPSSSSSSSEKGGQEEQLPLAELLCLRSDDLALIEEITATDIACSAEVLHARVLSSRPLYPDRADLTGVCFVEMQLAQNGSKNSSSSGATTTFTVLYAPLSSHALTTDQFLLPTEGLRSSLAQPFLRVGAQVRRCFAAAEGSGDDDSGSGSGSGTTSPAEWIEGQVYSVRPELARNPYQSVRVVWLSQDLEDEHLSWVYAYLQTDNLCSPWDLSQSDYVLPNTAQVQAKLPKSLTVGHLQASAILDHLLTLDCTSIFRYDLGKQASAEYLTQFPDARDRLDLNIISKWAAKGRYDGDDDASTAAAAACSSSSSSSSGGRAPVGAVGIATLFRDLERMVNTGLAFNDCNRDFLPWRQAEMTQQTITTLKRDLAKCHPSLTCLQDAVARDVERDAEAEAAESAVVEM
jgi:hypothetical protein